MLRKMADRVIRLLYPADATGWIDQTRAGDAGEVVNDESAMGLSAFWGCANLIAGSASTLPCMVYRTRRDGAREVAADHPLYRVLHDSPNYDQTAVDFWDYQFLAVELWGNAYARVIRNSRDGSVDALEPVAPAKVAVRRLDDGSLEYRWTDDGRQRVETDRTMIHVRGPGGNPLGGMSTLHFARNTLSAAKAAERAASAMFANGMRPSMSMAFENWLTPEQRKIAEDKLVDRYMGAVNTGRPIILEGGTRLEPITINPDDAQMLESRAFSVEEICRFFGVPPFMVGHTEKSTSWGTGIEQQTIGFVKFTLRRRLKRVEQALTKQLLTPADRAQGITIEFNLEGLLRGDSAGRAAFYQQMSQIGAMTINEIRALENLPPVPGGDVVRMQMQNVPIDSAPINAS